MKIIRNIVCIVGILAWSNTVLANNCPPINLIKDANFIKAASLTNDWWVLTSDTYNYQNRAWKTKFKFTAYFDNENDALKQGIVNYLSVRHTLQTPNETMESGKLTCLYTDSYDYEIFAQSWQ
ncbi:hypothetical protein ACNVED_08345 [Legionella sp. D16C41]|uniref:hypothetical protein n=1 Tax=Legionella sp. D16C41 TaxID=3402688 RepID=UPI003AF91973